MTDVCSSVAESASLPAKFGRAEGLWHFKNESEHLNHVVLSSVPCRRDELRPTH